jgi:hypothetical protein
MALKKCHECGQEISKSAKTCPGCGAKNNTRMSIGKIFVLVIFSAIVYSCVMSTVDSPAPAPKSKPAKSKPSAPPEPKTYWATDRSVNPKDDTQTIVMWLDPVVGKSRYGEEFTLVARCKSNTTELYIRWNEYLGDDSNDVYENWKYVTIRIDSDPAQKQKWGISTDTKATFSRSAIPTLRKMAKAKKLYAETVPYNENPRVAVYDLTGIEKPIKEIAEVCHWSL